MQILFPPTGNPPGLLRKVFLMLLALVFAALILTFSAVFFVVALVVGAVLWGGFWWKTRALRKQMQAFSEQLQQNQGTVFREEAFTGEIIEGEAVRVDEPESASARRR